LSSKYLLIIAFLIGFANVSLAQTEVDIIGGERSTINQIKKTMTIVENVAIKHNGVTIQCDSAIRKTETGIIEGFGNVYIFQPDTFYLSGGDYLRYDEKTKTALVTGKSVVLRDNQMTLTTTSILYNTINQTGFYTNGANIQNGTTNLVSKKGYYFRRSNAFNFKDNVVLTSPDYTMKSDTLDYFAGSKTAYFYGPTTIVSEENTIICNYGWYNTKTQKAQFSKKATIYSGSNIISADSLLYDKNKGEGRGIGNIKMMDTSEKIEVFGQKGLYYQKTKESWITENPVAIRPDISDTLFILADTFYVLNTDSIKFLKAFKNTEILQKEFQGKCDSLIYNFTDSSIAMYQRPILWNVKNQITGDTIFIYLKNKRINELKVFSNAFLAAEIISGSYNQISGNKMINSFKDNKLDHVLVNGDAKIIYYIADNDSDTAQYSGVNKESCNKMMIQLDSGKVGKIRFYGKPIGKIYPITDFPEGEKYLEGLVWQAAKKPKLESFMLRKQLIPKKFVAEKKTNNNIKKPKAKAKNVAPKK